MKELATRTLSGAVFTIVMVGGLLFQPLFIPLVMFTIFHTMNEFYSMTLGESFKAQRLVAVSTAWLLFILLGLVLAYSLPVRLLSLVILPFLAILLIPVWTVELSDHKSTTAIFTGLLTIGFPIAMLPLMTMRGGEYNGLMVLCLLAIIWISDVGAYALGTAVGQRPGAWKLAPKISPKKSWWGFLGAVLMGLVVAAVLKEVGLLKLPIGHCLALGAICSGFGVLGDLVESMWKRACGVKDSGNLIPGHGGLYDRIDSALVAIPASAVYLEIFGLLG